MKRISSLILLYFAAAGLVMHLAAVSAYLLKPDLVRKACALISDKVVQRFPILAAEKIQYSLETELGVNFPEWLPNQTQKLTSSGIHIGNRSYETLTKAAGSLQDGETLIIGAGVYTQPLVIRANNISVIGNGHVVIEKAAAEGKGAIVIKGNNTTINNIECKNIQVRDNNGACVRLEGKNLILKHVYFHNSQQGLLTGSNPGSVIIKDSRFELLGKNGQAHGIYIGGGELSIDKSLFVAAKSEGHEIKSRAAITRITDSIIASLSSIDSRLIDISDGGILEISDSILQQGPTSANGDMIGYALEKRRYPINSIKLVNNVFILERIGSNTLLHRHPNTQIPELRNNLIVAEKIPELPGFNLIFETRKEAGLEEYPMLPKRLSQP
ncbi:hypothetical protein [Neptunomonas qingdaonensis]|uniref:Right handed beta helix region n=1 Tax=Neptunomonas qingdaonensis TaxID=1045558 RepID=A0A1I2N0J1_9GAMM|nr:hypothetical protein [Neptunomonas qingdaonensis]SFF94891.1 hypothetical protein SAMN05216175_10289 [Neptunomonas qingdaonensis]